MKVRRLFYHDTLKMVVYFFFYKTKNSAAARNLIFRINIYHNTTECYSLDMKICKKSFKLKTLEGGALHRKKIIVVNISKINLNDITMSTLHVL